MKNQEFYRAIPLPRREVHVLERSFLFWITFLSFNIFAIILVPFSVPFEKGLELSSRSYFRLVEIAAAIAVLVHSIYFWSSEIVPYLNTRKGIYWRGVFTVVGKISIKESNYLLVKPGHEHLIKVKDEFFCSVHTSDRVVVDRNYRGSIRKIQRISGLKERIKSKNLPHENSQKPKVPLP